MKKRKLWLGFMCCQAVILSRNSQANQKKHGKNTSFRLTAKSQIHSAGIQKHFSEDFEAIKRFAVTSYVSKSSKITDFAEAGGTYFQKRRRPRKRKVEMENRKTSTCASYLPQKGYFFNTTCVQWCKQVFGMRQRRPASVM